MSIFRAALAAADPVDAVARHLRIHDGVLIAGRTRYRLRDFRKIYVIGAGKAGASMAQAIEKLGCRAALPASDQRKTATSRQAAPHRAQRVRPPGAR